MRNKSLSMALCAGIVLLSASSCVKDKDIVNEEFEVVTPGDPAGKPEVEKVTVPTAIIGNLGEAEEDVKNSFTNIVSPQEASIIIIESGAIKDNETVLSEAYAKGSLIAVFNPDGSVVSDWSDRNNVFYAGPDKDEKCAIYGFNNIGTYYSLQQTDDIGDEEVPLFHFCNWVNEVATKRYLSVNLRSNDIKQRFLPQSVTHTFKVSLDKQAIIDGHWGNPDQLSLSTTANVTYNIYPIHVFDGNAKGDYYVVEAEMVLHNAVMNNGNWVRRYGSEQSEICGFFLNRCDVSATLMRKSNGGFVESSTHAFANGANPHPASIADATTYNSGFAWTLDGTVSGGVPDSKDNHKLTTFNNWIWNNSAESALPGIKIVNNENSGKVGYSLSVNGLPSATDNLAVTPIPDLATGDLKFKYSWIWYVGDIADNSEECLYMQVGINPLYQAYKWITGGKMTIEEFENAVPESKTTFKFPLTPPNRAATCSAIIRNSSPGSYYISDIKLWRNKTTDKEPDYIVPQTICTSSAEDGSGVNATMLILPAGDYTVKGVRYSMQNDKRVDERVITNTKPITLTVAGNITIDFGSDIFTVQ